VTSSTHPPLDFETVIFGAGISGIGTAIEVQREGMGSFVLLEKADDLGGTWRDNTYPGIAVDIPSFSYSFSYENNHPWSRVFAPGAESDFGCKRPALSNHYLQAFNRDKVELVTEPIDRITKRGIVTKDGVEHAMDLLILGTGLETMERGNAPSFDVQGLPRRRRPPLLNPNRRVRVGSGASAGRRACVSFAIDLVASSRQRCPSALPRSRRSDSAVDIGGERRIQGREARSSREASHKT
jgi:cation diffusion facilitator CzcD-associated flavoprotein CzcO